MGVFVTNVNKHLQGNWKLQLWKTDKLKWSNMNSLINSIAMNGGYQVRPRVV